MANLRESSRVEEIYEYHSKMVLNLISGNAEEAKKLFADHLDGGFDGLNTVIEKYSDYFL